MRLAQRAAWLLAAPWRLVVLVAIMAALPIVVAGEVAAVDTVSRQEAAALASAKRAAIDTAAIFSDRVAAISRAIGNAAVRPVTGRATPLIDAFDRADQAAVQNELETIARYVDPAVARLVVLDANARAVAIDPFVTGYVGTDLSARPYATLGSRDLEVGDAFQFIDDTTRQTSSRVGLAVGTPIGTRQPSGYRLVALVDVKVLAGSLISELRPNFRDAYLVDRSGHLVLRASHAFTSDDLALRDVSGTSALSATTAVPDPIAPEFVVRGAARSAANGWSVLIADVPTPLSTDLEAALGQQRALRLGLAGVLLLGAALVGSALSTAIRRRRETAEALEQQTATADVLKTISRSAFDLQAVFDVVVENATKVCRGDWGYLFRREGDVFRLIASHGGTAELLEYERAHPTAITDRTLLGRVALRRKVVHIPDLFEDPDYDWPANREHGVHTVLGVPIFRDDEVVGAIGVARNDRQPFSDADIRLVQTFADQATIAMENVRLFNETKEALEQQTATGAVLQAISRTAFDVDSILRTLVQNAIQLCKAQHSWIARVEERNFKDYVYEGPSDQLRGVLATDYARRPLIAYTDATVMGRCATIGRPVHIDEVSEPEIFARSELVRASGSKTVLAVPILRGDVRLGVMVVGRETIQRFSDREVALIQTFADQAAIAIENVRLFNETKEALERQTALGEILAVIADSPADQQPVLDAIAKNATRYSGAADAAVLLAREKELHVAAHHGPIPTLGDRPLALERTAVAGRAVLDRHTFHVADVLGPEGEEFPQARARVAGTGQRALLAAPLLREGEAIGAILLRKQEPVPFTPNQIQLVEAFANQAVIAIENVRLFNETKEALERQTAISEILRAIANSPGNEKPVLATIAHSATMFCGAADAAILLIRDGQFRFAAHHGPVLLGGDSFSISMTRESVAGHAVMDRRTIQVADVLGPEGESYPAARDGFPGTGQRAILATPLVREGTAIGAIVLRKTEPGAFSASQVRLVEAFADQAVIAIENVRLFNETKESLEQQTAVGEVLKTISRSAFDLQPVLDIVLNNAVRLAGADIGWMSRVENEQFMTVSFSTEFPQSVREELHSRRTDDHLPGPWVPLGTAGGLMGFTLAEGRTVHLPDVKADPELKGSVIVRMTSSRTVVGVPMLREGRSIGGMVLARYEVRPFSERELELVQTFADQAAIAIENVRLFNETKEALERQTATAQVLRAISDSPTDVQPVMNSIAANAARYCRAEDVVVALAAGGQLWLRAHTGVVPTDLSSWPINRSSLSGTSAFEGRTLHIADIQAASDTYPLGAESAGRTGHRATLSAPLLREGHVLGVLLLRRLTTEPFAPREIELAETFAAQAAIAIENVRLFNETKEALDRQTAVAQVLGEISGSGFELEPVLETVIAHATKLCAAQQGFIYRREGDVFRLAVAHGITREFKAFTEANPINPMGRGTVTGRVVEDRKTVHIPDVLMDPEYTYWEAQQLGNFRAILGVPMMRDDEVIGVMLLWRTEPQPFTDEQMDLVTTFANQATIAVENVRHFDETKGALDRQTALSDILKVISASTFDLTPVAETVVERAARLCDADYVWVFLPERGQTRAKPRALYGDVSRELRDELMNTYVEFGGLADLRRTFQEPDVQAVTGWRIGGKLGVRTAVFVPVGRDRGDAGRIVLGRRVVRPFTKQQIDLVEIFADQAAIAIANARLFNEIQDKSRQLEVASRHKSEFLANMSHELRTPLNAIIGFSEVLIQGLFGDVNEKQREYLQDVIGSGQHLLSLINDILDLSKIEAGRMELELSTFSFRDALASGVTIVRERASRHNITLSVVVSDELGQVEADERKVKQIFYNLLSNAVKFTPDGGRVDVSVRRDNGEVRVDVRDTGIGIAQPDQVRIFEEFQQVGRERSREGTGLGLTLTKRFVELHGGRIWLESESGKGSTFAFTLPLRQSAPVRA
jgi:GAF domain-containing protein